MVDRLLHATEKTVGSSFVIKAGNVFVKNGLFQEAGLMENIAQTAALKVGYTAHLSGNPVENGYIGSVKNLEVFELPKINDELLTEINIEDIVFNVTILSGNIRVDDKLIACCEMKVFAGKE